MKYIVLTIILAGVFFLISCVTPIVDYELCTTTDCTPSVDIEIENAN